MNRIIITGIRDILNLITYMGISIAAVYYIYTFNPVMTAIKNVLFPMDAAIFACILISIMFVFVNRLTTFIALKIMKEK